MICGLSMKKKTPGWDAKRVRALRERFGDTQEGFAGRVGVTFASINRWEQGHSKPSPLARRLLEGLERKAS